MFCSVPDLSLFPACHLSPPDRQPAFLPEPSQQPHCVCAFPGHVPSSWFRQQGQEDERREWCTLKILAPVDYLFPLFFSSRRWSSSDKLLSIWPKKEIKETAGETEISLFWRPILTGVHAFFRGRGYEVDCVYKPSF